jgi:aspartate racemase
MKNNRKTIGIIGGMGPEASAHFYELLIKHAQRDFGVEKNEEFPDIFLSSIPVPDFISDEKRELEALEMLINKVEEMDKLRITFYCMACNTGHLLINKIKRKTDKPFISLVEELPKYIRKQKIKKVGLLATPTTIKTRLYEQVLEEYGIEVILPKNRDIELLGNIIKETIAGKNMDQNKVTVQHIARRLLKRGAEAIVESCTEIPLIFPKQHLIPVFDTLEILSEAVLKKYYSGTI